MKLSPNSKRILGGCLITTEITWKSVAFPHERNTSIFDSWPQACFDLVSTKSLTAFLARSVKNANMKFTELAESGRLNYDGFKSSEGIA